MRRRTRIGGWTLLAALVLAPCGARAESGGPPGRGESQPEVQEPKPAVEVALRAEARTSGDFVRVGDVADLSGGDEEERARAAGVYLGRAPSGGATRRLAARFVEARLADAGFAPPLVRVTGAPAAVVTHPAGAARDAGAVADWKSKSATENPQSEMRSADHARLLACAIRFLASRLGCEPEHLRVELVNVRVKGERPAGGAPLTYTIRPTGRRLLVGRVRLVADAFIRAEHAAEVVMDLDVTRFARVLVLTRAVRRGERLTRRALRSAVLDVRGSADYIEDAEAAASLVARRNLDAGTVLDLSMIEQPVLVQRNHPVLLVVERASLRVTERLLARGDGHLGQVIQVERPKTRQRFFACVTAAGTVTIPEGGL